MALTSSWQTYMEITDKEGILEFIHLEFDNKKWKVRIRIDEQACFTLAGPGMDNFDWSNSNCPIQVRDVGKILEIKLDPQDNYFYGNLQIRAQRNVAGQASTLSRGFITYAEKVAT